MINLYQILLVNGQSGRTSSIFGGVKRGREATALANGGLSLKRDRGSTMQKKICDLNFVLQTHPEFNLFMSDKVDVYQRAVDLFLPG